MNADLWKISSIKYRENAPDVASLVTEPMSLVKVESGEKFPRKMPMVLWGKGVQVTHKVKGWLAL